VARRIATVYGAVFVLAGIQLPYFPVWLDWRGLTPAEIAIVVSAPMLIRIVATPLIAFVADQRGAHREILAALSWLAAGALCLVATSASFATILALTAVFAIASTSVMPLTETIAMSYVRGAGLDYGRMRLWGSATFIAASFLGGLAISILGSAAGVWLMIAAAVGAALAMSSMPRAMVGGGAAARTPPRWRDAARLGRDPLFLVFLLATGTVQSAHAVLYGFGTLHWSRLGISPTWSGTLWAIGVISEIVIFAYAGRLQGWFGPIGWLGLGSGSAFVRWIIMGFDPGFATLLALQVLHGCSYGAAHIGAMFFIARAVPDAQAGTAQALYASVTAGIAMAGAMLLAGWLYGAIGGRAYWAMAALAAVSCVATAVLAVRWRGTVLFEVR
jgi:PPP family 3-phenylpropionic acid transporter